MKLNPITKNPEIMRGVFEIEDGKFMHDNPYGYITNLKDPEIHAEYIERRKGNGKCFRKNGTYRR